MDMSERPAKDFTPCTPVILPVFKGKGERVACVGLLCVLSAVQCAMCGMQQDGETGDNASYCLGATRNQLPERIPYPEL